MATHVNWMGAQGKDDNPMLHAGNWSCAAEQDKFGNVVDFKCGASQDPLTFPPQLPDTGDGHMLKSLTCQGEQCDDGDKNSDVAQNACRTNCTYGYCGDNIVDDKRGEECDKGADNNDHAKDACRTNCKKAHCGDGFPDTGEACDDGNNID